MKRFFQTLSNIWKIDELRSRILLTLGLILIYRVGSFVVLPGVDSAALKSTSGGGGGGLVELISLFTGGAFTRASIFALGIMPYISASIIMQLMGIAVPTVQKLQKEGESGRKKINQWTRILTIIICGFQAPGYLSAYLPVNARTESFSLSISILILIAGTMFIMWLGEKITENGIGNGVSLLIMIGIIAALPRAFIEETVGRMSGGGGLVFLLIEVVILLLVIVFSVMLVQGVRRVPVQFAKQLMGNRQIGTGKREYIPLKVNAAGVMPIIFAQAIMFVPIGIAGYAGAENNPVLMALSDFGGFWYNLVFATMIVVFTYFYTAITINPSQMADDMKRQGGFIPGIKPGRNTTDFIDTLLSRITLPGSIMLALVAILPAFAMQLGIKQGFAQFFGGTSLLIMVGVVLDTLQQIESHLLSRHYDGLMKSGRIKGRTSSPVGVAS